MFIEPPEELSTYLLLNRLGTLLFEIRKLDQQQKEYREMLAAYIRVKREEGINAPIFPVVRRTCGEETDG